MRYAFKLFSWFFVLSLGFACESGDDRIGESGSDSDSDNDSDSDADDDDDNNDNDNNNDDNDSSSDSDADSDSDEDETCGEWEANIERVDGKLMILQDLSSSMEQTIGSLSKWQIAYNALAATLPNYDDTIPMGFDKFSKGTAGTCGHTDPLLLDVVENNTQAVLDTFAAQTTLQSTPLYLSQKRFLDENSSYAPGLFSPGRDPYMVIVSDGQDTCGETGSFQSNLPSGALATQTAALLSQFGIKTFVIGFGSSVSPTELNEIAANGGTAFTTYIIAEDQATLTAAFDAIGTAIAQTCEWDVVPPADEEVDMDTVNFLINDEELLYNADCAVDTNDLSWTWTCEPNCTDETKTRIRLCPAACDYVKALDTFTLTATFGCPPDTDVTPV